MAKSDRADIEGLFHFFWSRRKSIAATGLAAAVLAFVLCLLAGNLYRATAVIKPVPTEEGQGVTEAYGLALGAIGLRLGGQTQIEDLDVVLRSQELSARVFERHGVLETLESLERKNPWGRVASWWDRTISDGDPGKNVRPDWKAIRKASDLLEVRMDKKSGVISVSFLSPDPELSASVVRHYLEEAQLRLQEDALARAKRNKQFIKEQISSALDPLTLEQLYKLYGREISKEMMARNSEQFGFITVDPARSPDKKYSPRRLLISSLSALAGVFLSMAVHYFREDLPHPT